MFKAQLNLDNVSDVGTLIELMETLSGVSRYGSVHESRVVSSLSSRVLSIFLARFTKLGTAYLYSSYILAIFRNQKFVTKKQLKIAKKLSEAEYD